MDWREIADGRPQGALLSGWASGPNSVWLVGGDPGRAEVLQWNGEQWTTHQTGLTEQLWWIHGFSDTDIFVVGDRGAAARFNGDSWIALDTGAPGTTLYGVWGADPNEVWVVGGPSLRASESEREGDVVLRWNGTAFARFPVADLENKPASMGKNLFKVWGTTRTDAFIVGDSGQVLRYDGSQWSLMDSGASGQPLFTVVGRSASDVWAIGGLADSILIHFDGTAWSRVELPLEAPQVIQGIYTAPGLPVYVAGYQGFTGELSANGTWKVVETGSNLAYHAIFGDGKALWAVGGNIYSVLPTYVGTAITSALEPTDLPDP